LHRFYIFHVRFSFKVLKGYISALLETLNESDPGVRESSAEALGALVKFMGEGKVEDFSLSYEKLSVEMNV